MSQLTFDSVAKCLDYIEDLPNGEDEKSDLASKLCSLFGCLTVGMLGTDSTGVPIIQADANIDPYWAKQYGSVYSELDPSLGLLNAQKNSVIDHITLGRPNHLRGKERLFYNELMVPQNYRYTLARVVTVNQNNQLFIVLTRGVGMSPFCANDRVALDALSDRLVKNWQCEVLFDQPVEDGKSRRHSLSPNNSCGYTARLLIAGDMRLMSYNSEALLFLKAGYFSITSNKKLKFYNSIVQGRVISSLSACGECWVSKKVTVSGFDVYIEPSLSMSRRPDGYFFITIQPLSPLEDSNLINLSCLTSTERWVLEQYMLGLTPQEIALDNSKSIHTVRTQIKNIKRKLDCVRLPRNIS